ncbi:MAG TPA: RNA polymerase sigma factor [Polyangia bacterium]|nr:RNA polymerase sigma factor [Polyangia bacterium]
MNPLHRRWSPAPARAEADPLAPLLAPATAGDADALARILRAAAPAMLGVVRMILGADNADVPDVAQESLLAVKDALRSFRRESTVLQFARQVAVRTALSSRRGRRARDRLLDRYRVDVAAQPAFTDATDPALRARRAAAFRRVLDDLPDEQAETFALRVVLDYSLEEVAAATGVPVNTVRSRVRLAREKLRERIEADPALHDVLMGEA